MTNPDSKSQLSPSLSKRLTPARRALVRASAGAIAAGTLLGAASSARAGNLPMAVTSYLDTSANVVHVFYLGGDGGVYDLSSPLSQASSGAWSCSPTLPPMSVTYRYGFWHGVEAGGMFPGSNLAATYDGTTGHLYYMGSDGGVWTASGNPPTAASGESINALVGAAAPMPAGQLTNYCVGTRIGSADCYQGVDNPATIAATSGGRIQNVLYQGADSYMHDLEYGAPSAAWEAMRVGSNAANAVNGKGLSAATGSGAHVFFDDAAGNAEIFDQLETVSQGGSVGVSWRQDTTLNVDFHGFLASAFGYTGGYAGLSVAGPDPSQVDPTMDTATNADSTQTWSIGGLSEPYVPTGPMLMLSTGSNATAPNGLDSWLYFVGATGEIYAASNGHKLSGTANIACNGPNCYWAMPAAQSTSNTPNTPLTGFYSSVDSTVRIFYVGDNGGVYMLPLVQDTPTGMNPTNVAVAIVPASCPTAMN